jgi:hypothetical protein
MGPADLLALQEAMSDANHELAAYLRKWLGNAKVPIPSSACKRRGRCAQFEVQRASGRVRQLREDDVEACNRRQQPKGGERWNW